VVKLWVTTGFNLYSLTGHEHARPVGRVEALDKVGKDADAAVRLFVKHERLLRVRPRCSGTS
jgi:hypothetical protein